MVKVRDMVTVKIAKSIKRIDASIDACSKPEKIEDGKKIKGNIVTAVVHHKPRHHNENGEASLKNLINRKKRKNR